MASALRSVAVLAVASALAVLSAPGCSQQGEGDRCDVTADCDAGLTCVAARTLLVEIVDRCCPAEGSETSERCVRKSAMNTAGTSGGGSAGTGGGAGEPAGGTSAGGSTEEGGAPGNGGGAGEPGAGGMTVNEGGAAGGGVGGVPAGAGAPAAGAGQGGAD